MDGALGKILFELDILQVGLVLIRQIFVVEAFRYSTHFGDLNLIQNFALFILSFSMCWQSKKFYMAYQSFLFHIFEFSQ